MNSQDLLLAQGIIILSCIFIIFKINRRIYIEFYMLLWKIFLFPKHTILELQLLVRALL